MKSVAEHATEELTQMLDSDKHFTLSYIETEEKQVRTKYFLTELTYSTMRPQQLVNIASGHNSTFSWSVCLSNVFF